MLNDRELMTICLFNSHPYPYPYPYPHAHPYPYPLCYPYPRFSNVPQDFFSQWDLDQWYSFCFSTVLIYLRPAL